MNELPPVPPRSGALKLGAGLIACGLLAIFSVLIVRGAATMSATTDEVAHLPAGYANLRWKDFRMNPEHPPLVKELAAAGMSLRHPWVPGPSLSDADLSRCTGTERLVKLAWATGLNRAASEWAFGYSLLFGTTPAAQRRCNVSDPRYMPTTTILGRADFLNEAGDLLFWGRMGILPLGVLLAILVLAWAIELWGPWGGLLSLGLVCLDPNLVAHSGLVTTDVGITTFLFGAVYFLWRTCDRIAGWNLAGLLACFGLAFVSKFSSVLLVPSVCPDPGGEGGGRHPLEAREIPAWARGGRGRRPPLAFWRRPACLPMAPSGRRMAFGTPRSSTRSRSRRPKTRPPGWARTFLNGLLSCAFCVILQPTFPVQLAPDFGLKQAWSAFGNYGR